MQPEEPTNDTFQTLKALLSMIDEPDPRVYSHISDSIFAMGSAVIPFLKNELDNTFSPTLRERYSNLINIIRFEGILNAIQRWKTTLNHDLIQFMKILARFHDPEMNHVAVENILLKIRKEIWLELSENLTSLESIRLINHILFTNRALNTDISMASEPDNFFLNQFLVHKTTHPTALGAFYLGICQRLTISAYYVDLPGNFILAYTSQNALDIEPKNASPVFYINPVAEGVIFNRKQIDVFIESNGLISKPEYYNPCQNLLVAQKLLEEMNTLYRRLANHFKASQVTTMLEALT